MGRKKQSEFLDSGIINEKNVEKAEHVILGVPYDVTSSGMKGADKGPAAVMEALREQIEPHNTQVGYAACEFAKIAYVCEDLVSSFSPAKMVEAVSAVCYWLLREGRRLTIIGGEHSVTIPALKAYAKMHNADEVTILHIDAHLDLRDKDEFRRKPYGEFAHCCVMRRAYDFGFRHFVQVGARSYSEEEIEFVKFISSKGDYFMDDYSRGMRMNNLPGIAQEICTEKVWVSLDVDGICPGDMPATGTPVGGGPSFEYVRELLFQVSRQKIIVGADVVEVAPDLGLTNLTAYNAAQLAYDLIAYRIDREREVQGK